MYGIDVRFPDSSYVTGPHGEFGDSSESTDTAAVAEKTAQILPTAQLAERESSDAQKGRV